MLTLKNDDVIVFLRCSHSLDVCSIKIESEQSSRVLCLAREFRFSSPLVFASTSPQLPLIKLKFREYEMNIRDGAGENNADMEHNTARCIFPGEAIKCGLFFDSMLDAKVESFESISDAVCSYSTSENTLLLRDSLFFTLNK